MNEVIVSNCERARPSDVAHPLRQVDGSLLSDELENSDVSVELGDGGVGDLKVERKFNVELGCSWMVS